MNRRKPYSPLVRSVPPRTLVKSSSLSVPVPARPWNDAQTACAVLGVTALLGIWLFAD